MEEYELNLIIFLWKIKWKTNEALRIITDEIEIEVLPIHFTQYFMFCLIPEKANFGNFWDLFVLELVEHTLSKQSGPTCFYHNKQHYMCVCFSFEIGYIIFDACSTTSKSVSLNRDKFPVFFSTCKNIGININSSSVCS